MTILPVPIWMFPARNWMMLLKRLGAKMKKTIITVWEVMTITIWMKTRAINRSKANL
jgi:hypothetical protein